LTVNGHAVDRSGKIWTLPSGVNPERGRIAFQTSVRYVQEHFEAPGPVRFSALGDNQSGWTNIGSNLWAAHGAITTVPNDSLDWTATVEDHGENWRFQTLKVGRTTIIQNGHPVEGTPTTAQMLK